MFGPGRLSHLDCQQPRVLSAEERALLFTYCRDHPVGNCIACAGDFKLSELALDVLGFLRYLCPRCRRDLTDSVRAHLYGCAMLPMEVRRRAQVARETVRSLVKQSYQRGDAADVLMREAESALAALREAMRQTPILRRVSAIEHQGWQITPHSYEVDGARWCPKALMRNVARESLHTQVALARMFDTKQDADAYAVEMAKRLIDNHGQALA